MSEKKTGLDLLREPFPAHQISKLPKPTKAQTDAVRNDYRSGIRCQVCGGWHHKDVIHLDYVGHAALTDRLLDADPSWYWEPLALSPDGLPAIDKDGGLWIKLTVLGVTRLGYGDAQGKTGGDAMKERIGDALRNAAMRFGAALDLWHKGDLHLEEEKETTEKQDVISPTQLIESAAPDVLTWLKDQATEIESRIHAEDHEAACIQYTSVVNDFKDFEEGGFLVDRSTQHEAFHGLFDSSARALFKGYQAILRADSQDMLQEAWGSLSRASKAALQSTKDRRKDEIGIKS